MSPNLKATGSALALIAALLAINAAHAQTKPATATVAKPSASTNQQAATPEAMFTRWDKDKNNALSQAEFKAGWQEVQTAMVLRQLHENFVQMDANKSGAIEVLEYANLGLVKQAGASAPPMSTFDLDKNQRLEFKEYVGMVRSMTKPKAKG